MGWRLVPPDPEHHADFEKLCRDVLSARLGVELARHGRSGQTQQGADLLADLPSGLRAFQFKCVKRLTLKNIEAEVAQADSLQLPVTDYTVLASIEADAKLQGEVVALSRRRRDGNRFPVFLVPWPEIRDWLVQYPDLVRRYYPAMFATVPDLVDAQRRRLDHDFPGATLELHATGTKLAYTIRPGSTPIELTGAFVGDEAVARFENARRLGTEVTFAQDEFKLDLPKALTDILGARSPTKLQLRPSAVGREETVSFLVEPRGRFRSFHQFERDVQRGRLAGIGATFRVLRDGTESDEFEVVPLALPMALVVTRTRGSAKARCDLERRFEGASVESAAAVETIRQQMADGAYMAITGPGFVMCMAADPADADDLMAPAIALLVELADVTGWELKLGEQLGEEELEFARELLALFRDGRRAVGRGGTFRCPVNDDADRATLLTLIDEGTPPYNVRLSHTLDFTLLGHSGSIRCTQAAELVLTPELRAEVERGVLPFKVPVPIRDDVEVFETLDEDLGSVTPALTSTDGPEAD